MDNVDLARQISNTPLRSKDTQKRLWLKIAKHVIKKDEDIGKWVWFILIKTTTPVLYIFPPGQ